MKLERIRSAIERLIDNSDDLGPEEVYEELDHIMDLCASAQEDYDQGRDDSDDDIDPDDPDGE